MNRWGIQGCKDNLETIIGWMTQQAKEHKWATTETDNDGSEIVIETVPPLKARLARFIARRRGGKLLLRPFIKRIVFGAIKQAEREAAKAATAYQCGDS